MVFPHYSSLSLKVSLITGFGALFALSPFGISEGLAAGPLSSDVSITQTGPVTVNRPSQGVVSVTFTSVIRNSGPNKAKDVFLVAGPTTGGVYQNKRFIGCTSSDLLGRCNVGSIEPNTSKTVSLTYDLPAKTPCKTMNIAHFILAWSQKTKDPNMANNSAFVKTAVNCPAATPQARLDIAVKTIGSMDTAVKNQKNINLLRFEARSDTANNILMETLLFTAETGSLLNGQNYGLWVDTDGNAVVDTILQDGVWPANGTIFFSNLHGGGYVIPASATVAFEVHADIASSLMSNNYLQLKFATPSSAYVTATDDSGNGNVLAGIATNGSCASTSCQIFVSTTPSKVWKLLSQGSLYVTKDTTPVRSRQLLGGTLGSEILRLNFRAENEDIDVTDLQLNTWDSLGQAIDRLELYRAGEATPFAMATIGGCGSDDVLTKNPANGASISAFCANMESRQLVIAKDSEVDVLVKPRMKNDENGAVSGELITLWITKQAVSNNATGSGAVRARGGNSSNNLSANNGNTLADGEIFIGRNAPATTNADIVGNPNQVVLAKIISITNANPDANGTAIPMGAAPHAIGQFRFDTAANVNSKNGLNKVQLGSIIFNVSAVNVDIDGGSFKFYNKADSSTKMACSIVGSQSNSGSLAVLCDQPENNNIDTVISSGQSGTFVLEATITNPNVTGSSSLQVSLTQLTDINSLWIGTQPGQTHLDWEDRDSIRTTAVHWVDSPETTFYSTQYNR